MNDVHSISHSKWRWKYHVVLPPALSITQEHISTHKIKFSSTYVLNIKAASLARLLENIFAIPGFFRVSPQKSLQRGLVLSPQS